MQTAQIAFNQIAIMFFLILVGVACFKVKLIDKETNRKLSDIVLMLVNPIVIFCSYQREFNEALLYGLLLSLLLAFITHLFGILITYVILPRKNHAADISIERFAVIYSNCGFIGIPLINGIFGSEGVFYMTAYMTIFNLVVWTHGMITVSGKSDKRTILKAITSPSIIATVLGFILFVSKIILPDIINTSLSYLGNMNTPLAMLVAGVTIAQANLKKVLFNIRIYYITFFKLLFIPIVMLLIYQVFDIPNVVLQTSIIAVACPTAATINLFSIRYNKNYLYASELFAVTTILSVLTIPLVVLAMSLILK